MPAEIDTLKLLDHIGAKIDGVHAKIDDHAKEARTSLLEFRTETTAALGTLAVEIGKHETRIDAIEGVHNTESTRADGWWKTGAAIVLGGGGLTAILEWLRSGKH